MTRLERAERWLPPDVAMAIECAADETGDETLLALWQQMYTAAMAGNPIYPGESLAVTEGNALLLLPKDLRPVTGSRETVLRALDANAAWGFAAAGLGSTPEAAEETALSMLFSPVDAWQDQAKLLPAGRKARYARRLLSFASGGNGNFCALYLLPWALRRASEKL